MKTLFLLFSLLMALSLYAHPGIGIAADAEGNIFYTDLVHVWKISPDGERTIAVPNVHTHELFLDANGDLYGEHEWYEGEETDRWGHYIWCLGHDGKFEKMSEDAVGFLQNTTLVRDNDNQSYYSEEVAGQRIIYLESPNEGARRLSGHAFDDVRWMYFSPHDDHLYVVDGTKLFRISKRGQAVLVSDRLKERGRAFGGVADRHYVFGVCTDEKENVYVAVYGAQKVIRIDRNGQHSTVYTSESGWSPCGITIDQKGHLWIMEFSKRNKARVVKVE